MPRKQKLFTVAAARRRALETATTAVQEPRSPLELCFASARATRLARKRLQALEERTVLDGREAGLSWDELGRWLATSGESLRRRYGQVAG